MIFRILTLAGFSALLPQTSAAAPGSLDPAIKAQALDIVECAQRQGIGADARSVTIIDYGRPSLEPRLWTIALDTGVVEVEEYVAHGKNSGANLASRFSNTMNSLQTSLGLFITAETYVGGNGYSLRLDGLVPGVNDRARDRAIVIHGARYVDPVAGAKQGRLGRSFGCPALRSAVANGLIDMIKGGNFIYAHHPKTDWVMQSPFGKCARSASNSRSAGLRSGR